MCLQDIKKDNIKWINKMQRKNNKLDANNNTVRYAKECLNKLLGGDSRVW